MTSPFPFWIPASEKSCVKTEDVLFQSELWCSSAASQIWRDRPLVMTAWLTALFLNYINIKIITRVQQDWRQFNQSGPNFHKGRVLLKYLWSVHSFSGQKFYIEYLLLNYLYRKVSIKSEYKKQVKPSWMEWFVVSPAAVWPVRGVLTVFIFNTLSFFLPREIMDYFWCMYSFT